MFNLTRLYAAVLLTVMLSPAVAQISFGDARGHDGSPPFDEDLRIVGGDEVSSSKAWPWQIALFRKAATGEMSFACGGSLIAERWVLTAAPIALRMRQARRITQSWNGR